MVNEALPALDVIVDQVNGMRQRMESGEFTNAFDDLIERLFAVIEEVQISNEELRLTLADLQFERSRYRALFDHSEEGTLLTDGAGTITAANRAAGALLGCDPRMLVGRHVVDLAATGHAGVAAQHTLRGRSGRQGDGIVTLRRGDGTPRMVQLRYLPLESTGEDAGGTQWLLLDLERPLFETEDRATEDPVLARRWLTVYGELQAATESLVQAATTRAERLDEPARASFEVAQLQPLELRLSRIRQGMGYWRRRHASLIDLEFDLASPDVRYRDRAVRMTLRERQLLHVLLAHPDHTFPGTALLVQAWHSSYLAEEQLRTYVGRLRRKLDELNAPCHLVNRRGHGYTLVFAERAGGSDDDGSAEEEEEERDT